MGALGTILKWVILLPILAAVVLLAVANSQTVTVHLNPFDTGDPVLRFDLALYQLGFAVFVLGVLVGGVIAGASRRRRRLVPAEPSPTTTPRDWRGEMSAPNVPAPPPGTAVAAFLPRPERG